MLLILTGFNFMCMKFNSFMVFNFFYSDSISYFLNLMNFLVFFSFFLFYNSIFNLQILTLLFIIMYFMFVSTSYISLYIFFELSIIPIFVIIVYQGKQFERKKASIFLFFFTLVSSFPLMIIILILKNNFFNNFSEENFMNNFGQVEFFFIFLAFMVKLPVYFFHMWLPKAHVEAPVYGSMVLAGVMLKLGGYGIVKAHFLFFKLWAKFNSLSSSVFICGMAISSIYCLFLSDFKIMIAVSSVSHMTFFLVSLSSCFKDSLDGSFILLLAHGFVSPLLFFVSYILYKRVNSRSMIISKSYYSSQYSVFLMIVCAANFCIPPSLNFFSEVIMSVSLITFSKFLIFHLLMYMMVSTCYSLLIYSNISTHNHNFFNSHEMDLSEMMTSVFYLIMVYSSFMLLNMII